MGGDLKRKRKIKNDWTEKRGKLMPYTVALQLHTYWWCCWLEAWEIIFPNVLRGIRNTRLWTFTVSKQTSKKTPTVPFVYTFVWLEFGIEKLLDSMFFENMTLQILLTPKWFSILYNLHYTVHTVYNILCIYLFKTCSVQFSSKCS